MYEGDPPFVKVLRHEAVGFYNEPPPSTLGQLSDLPTAAELALVPATVDARTRRLIMDTPWLQPGSDGVWCRCCKDTELQASKVFISSPLPYGELSKRLKDKISNHINTKKKGHETKWKQFKDARKAEAQYGASGPTLGLMEDNAERELHVQKFMNTQELVHLIHDLVFVAKNDSPHTTVLPSMHNHDCIFDPGRREFMKQNFNLSSATISSELLRIVSDVVTTQTSKKIMDSPFCGLMMDESQDIKKVAQHGIYYRILVKTEKGLEATEVFWGIKPLKKRNTAENIVELLRRELPEEYWPRTLAITSDGSSPMSGSEGGVVLLLQLRKCPFSL